MSAPDPLITGVVFLRLWTYSGWALKIGVPCGCPEETSIFKIIMIDDV